MSTSQHSSPQLPSYETLRAAQQWVRLTPEARRLFWTLQGPLTEAISVMRSERDPDPAFLEPYFRGQETWHPFSQAPLTEPNVSSITVACADLEHWEDAWLECHRDCTDPDNFSDGDDDGSADYDSDQDEEDSKHLLECCGTKRPQGKESRLTVKPATGPFVTIHDYLAAVHPWLLGSRGDLLTAKGVWESRPLPADTKLMVTLVMPEHLSISKEEDWIRATSRPPNPLIASMTVSEGGPTQELTESRGW